MTFYRLALLAAVVVSACGGSPAAPSPPEAPSTDFDKRIVAHLESIQVPGLSVALLKHGSVTTKVYGWADVERKIAVTPDTIFQVGSISKTFTGTAVMQLVEAGRLNLDEDVNRYPPFAVRNPAFPSVPITLRQLMTHSSSIRDNGSLLSSLNRSPIPLASFLQDYLLPGHQYASNNFYSYAPGGGVNYANVGGALAGYVVEVVGGRPYESITRDQILTPLGMQHAEWAPVPIAGVPNAVPYKDYRAIQPDEYPMLTPSGSLRTDAPDLARFLQMFMQGGTFNGTQVLTNGSVAEMRRIQFPQLNGAIGLFWYYQNGYFGHSGALAGMTSFMFFRPGADEGVVMLMNGHLADDTSRFEEALQMMDEFFAFAAQL